MKYKILIIEDDLLTKKFYNYIFTSHEFDIIILEDAQQIFEILKNEDISLIIMDINLKNTKISNQLIDGIQLTKIIKTDEKLKRIPLVLVSAYNQSKKNKEDCLADDYFQKPIMDFNLFLERIVSLIEESTK